MLHKKAAGKTSDKMCCTMDDTSSSTASYSVEVDTLHIDISAKLSGLFFFF